MADQELLRVQSSPVPWGRRIYLAIVAMIGLLSLYPLYNHLRITRLEQLRADIVSSGGRAPRARGGLRPVSEIYWESLGGDLSRVVLRQVEFPQSARLDRSAIARLGGCPQLSRLSLDGQGLDDGVCREIFSLAQLSELRIAYCGLRDEQIAGVERMDGLTALDLRGTRISDASIDRLSRLAWLSELQLDYTDVTAAGAQRLAKALPQTQIRHRSWPSAEHRDAALRLYQRGASLDVSEGRDRCLAVGLIRHQWRGSPQDLTDIGHLQGLERLELSGVDLEPELLAAVARLPNLQTLSITRCQLPDAELPRLRESASIRRLILDDLFVELPDAEALGQWRGVRSLALVNARLVPGSLAALTRDLEELAIIGLRIRDTSIAELASARQLKRLHLSRVVIGDPQVQELCQMANLECLSLTGMAVTDDSVGALAGLRALAHLDLSNTRMSAAGIARLTAALPQCRVKSGTVPIEELDVWSLLDGARGKAR